MPEEKTTVTKDTVSESVREKLMEEGRVQAKAEFDRQQAELSEKVSTMEAEKAELESRLSELSKAEERRLNELTDEKKIAESQLYELETKPEFAGYREKISRETSRMKSEAVSDSTHETSKILMSEFIERKAEEEKIPVSQLREELASILKISGTKDIRYPHLLPHERAKVAYAERAEKRKVQALEDEVKRLKAERDGFSEDGSRVPRETRTTTQLREEALNGSKEAAISLARDLDKRQAELDAQLNK